MTIKKLLNGTVAVKIKPLEQDGLIIKVNTTDVNCVVTYDKEAIYVYSKDVFMRNAVFYEDTYLIKRELAFLVDINGVIESPVGEVVSIDESMNYKIKGQTGIEFLAPTDEMKQKYGAFTTMFDNKTLFGVCNGKKVRFRHNIISNSIKYNGVVYYKSFHPDAEIVCEMNEDFSEIVSTDTYFIGNPVLKEKETKGRIKLYHEHNLDSADKREYKPNLLEVVYSPNNKLKGQIIQFWSTAMPIYLNVKDYFLAIKQDFVLLDGNGKLVNENYSIIEVDMLHGTEIVNGIEVPRKQIYVGKDTLTSKVIQSTFFKEGDYVLYGRKSFNKIADSDKKGFELHAVPNRDIFYSSSKEWKQQQIEDLKNF